MASFSLCTTFLILFASLALLTTSSSAYNLLRSGEKLKAGKFLFSGPLNFTMQADCNLVLYLSGAAIWASGTDGKATKCYAKLEFDGNLAIYSGTTTVWATNTHSDNGNYVLVLQKDRNVVIYGPMLWSTGTAVSASTPGTP